MRKPAALDSKPEWSSGSTWHRWDPHLHAPGTLHNDQFNDDWEGYLKAINSASPPASALGITDYFCLRTYKCVLGHWRKGALPLVRLLFPNIEVRLSIETEKRKAINLHLLVSPDDPEHIERIEQYLSTLTFRYVSENYPCSEAGLIRLGRAFRSNPKLEEAAALREGANQFKIDLNKLSELRDRERWFRDNVLIAVASGNDGTAGLARDSSFRAQREEIERLADIIFSSRDKDRRYWLGEHPEFDAAKTNVKPCLHGSDCHSINQVLTPDQDRRCWLRAAPTFEGLRQALAEPDRRVHIGITHPAGPNSSDTIRALRFKGAPWLSDSQVLLNDGLVTVIGSRGSGKTALADLVALGASSLEPTPGPASFVAKAGEFLDGLEVEIQWADGTQSSSSWDNPAQNAEPRIRYLSQQFVERLCAPQGLAQELVLEIERIVYCEIAEEERVGAASFEELRNLKRYDLTLALDAARRGIRSATDRVSEETGLRRTLPDLERKLLDAQRQCIAITNELAAIPVVGTEERRKTYTQVSTELQALQTEISTLRLKAQQYAGLVANLEAFRTQADAAVLTWRQRFGDLLTEAEWAQLTPRIDVGALSLLNTRKQEAIGSAQRLDREGLAPQQKAPARGLEVLRSEQQRLTAELGLDQANEKKRTDLTRRLTVARSNESKLRHEVTRAQGCAERLKQAQADRLASYMRLFEVLCRDVDVLGELYGPLKKKLQAAPALQKLSFDVRRYVSIEDWAARGEELLDLRKKHAFNRRGELERIARLSLLHVWQLGSPVEVRDAMASFALAYGTELADNLARGVSLMDLAEWMFSTDHIRVEYGIRYEGVDLERLSPGTRGVVLLIVYLALDTWDTRPLVIDQPEENLDPQSIYDDLVRFFREASRRRQIIMVTHNANLVVNTDSDQIIVAQASRTTAAGLPVISYRSGGLEHPEIRTKVCRLLEGGREAFERRGLRYALRTMRP